VFRPRDGFTLIELSIVVAILGIVLAVAVPRLLPSIAFSAHESAARHLAGYGRSAMAYCALRHDHIMVKVDLDRQEYWAEHLAESAADAVPGESAGLFGDGGAAPSGTVSEDYGTLEEMIRQGDTDAATRVAELRERFDRYMRLTLEARSRNVKREGMLDDIGPKFGKFDLDDDKQEHNEVGYYLLTRTALPEEGQITEVRLGDRRYTKGVVDVEVSPIGLTEPVTFLIRGPRDDYYTVAWDPITGGARMYEGRQEAP